MEAASSKETGLSRLRDGAARSAAAVDDHVLISGYLAAADKSFIDAQNVRFILKMFRDTPDYPGGAHRHAGVEYMVVPAEDRADYDISAVVPAALAFIAKARASGHRVLVHCHMGVSRSATVVICYLMAFYGMTLDSAARHLQSRRPVVNPNEGFVRFLQSVEASALATSRFVVGRE